jgi:ABC-type multidrug transport system ATPase subunit
MTLVGDPRIIFLDEPTTGLDPRSRRTVWRIIRDLVGDGVTVFLTTSEGSAVATMSAAITCYRGSSRTGARRRAPEPGEDT